ncbi:hypothetical protein BH11BAC3_BH11BAC3_37350 [soil metagenome]
MFLAAFAIQTFDSAFIVVDYFANTKAYAKNCENKEIPKMHCNGKCQMMKKIKQEQKKDQQNPDRRGENKNEIIISSKSFYPTLVFPFTQIQTAYSTIASGKEITMPRTLLRPPIC